MAARSLRTWKFSAGLWSAPIGAILLCLVLLPCQSTQAAAALPKADDSLFAKTNDVKNALRAGMPGAGDRKLVEDYMTKFFLVQFVNPSPRFYSINDLPKLRGHLKALQTIAKGGGTLEALNKIVFGKMTGILRGGPHGEHDKAIKYNAMLVVADMDEPAAFALMLNVLQSPKAPDYLRTAALLGLQRVATVGEVPKDKADELTKALLTILTQETPPQRSASVQSYLRRRAGQALAAMGNPGPNNSVVKALEAIAGDPKARPIQRCEMAQFLGEIKYPANSITDVQRLANMMGHQTVEICKHELERAKAEDRDPSRRLLMYSIDSTYRLGLKGLAAAAEDDADTKASIAKLKSRLNSLYTKLNDPALQDSDIPGVVEAELPEIEGLLTAQPEKSEPLAAAGKEAPAKPAAK